METGIDNPTVIEAVEVAREIIGDDRSGLDHPVTARMPAALTPDAIVRVPNMRAIDIIHQCIADAEEVKRFCRDASGRVRNQKMFLTASAHMRASVETLSRVAERINDAQKIEQLQNAIIEEIRKEKPETAERMLNRIGAVLDTWGF